MTDQKDSGTPSDDSKNKSPNPALMIGGIFAALAGMAVAVLSAKKNTRGGKPGDPAP